MRPTAHIRLSVIILKKARSSLLRTDENAPVLPYAEGLTLLQWFAFTWEQLLGQAIISAKLQPQFPIQTPLKRVFLIEESMRSYGCLTHLCEEQILWFHFSWIHDWFKKWISLLLSRERYHGLQHFFSTFYALLHPTQGGKLSIKQRDFVR